MPILYDCLLFQLTYIISINLYSAGTVGWNHDKEAAAVAALSAELASGIVPGKCFFILFTFGP